MAKLLIVESPAKAKTITKYLGTGYQVKASMGHLRDLPKKELGVDVDNNFQTTYLPIEGKDKIINDLKDAADQADFVYLATDPDREGEAISWHLQQLLELDARKTQRVTFNEITKSAVTEAVKHPRDIDMNLVDAQQARRILDRIVGYKLSPFLWRKVRTGLSAGRVQSVVTRMVVDREREIRAFVPQEYWSIDVTLNQADKDFVAHFFGNEQGKQELPDEDSVKAVLADIEGQPYEVKAVKNAKKKRQPAPPFTTSTLQQEASRKLGLSARRTMAVAQELYEGVELEGLGLTGLITYMRTDSLRIADEALAAARSFISGRFGTDFQPAKARTFHTKKNAQDAHEAIRPSNPALEPEQLKKSLTPDQYKLYKLIWSRFIACQMADAVLDTMSADIGCGGRIFRATGQSVAFPGFLALYEESTDEVKDDGNDLPLPKLQQGDRPDFRKVDPKQHFTQPPARYTEASLIKAMEEKGVGRPSTYAPTISVVLDREYVVKEGRALRPTNLGEVVTDLMIDKFQDIVDVQFTSNMESRLDLVESGEQDYRQILDGFYKDFSAELAQAEIDLDKKRIKVPDEESDEVCDLCGRKMVIKNGRFGKFLACPGYPECKNTKPITQDTGVTCPKCGSRLLKKKSKSGYYYYGCERNPECDFMTWDSPTKKVCPQCGGVVYRHYTKEDKRYLCHKPDCGWSEAIATRTRKKAETAEGEEPKKTTRGRKKAAETAEVTEVKKTTRGRKKAETAAEEPKKTTKKAAGTKKTAKKSDETPKKTTRKKKTEAAE
ncbi:MAG: type I DNA topoisomerase [Clostridia bacterium]|nr:type I DNA topoisomerase [Clostridia bacterium]